MSALISMGIKWVLWDYMSRREILQQKKIKRKKQFVIDYLNYLKQLGGKKEIPYVICGDLNVLEEKHVPHYQNFLKWEYDFYGRFSILAIRMHFGCYIRQKMNIAG